MTDASFKNFMMSHMEWKLCFHWRNFRDRRDLMFNLKLVQEKIEVGLCLSLL